MLVSDIRETLKEIILEVTGCDEELITAEASLSEDLGCDSLDIVEIIMEIEERFKLEIDEEDIVEKVTRFEELTQYVSDKVNAHLA